MLSEEGDMEEGTSSESSLGKLGQVQDPRSRQVWRRPVLRDSHRQGPAEPAVEVVTAVSQEFRRVLGQQGVGEDGRLAAALRPLRATPLQGKPVVADAGLLCRPLVDTVPEQGGDYLGVLKDNQAKVKWLPPPFPQAQPPTHLESQETCL